MADLNLWLDDMRPAPIGWIHAKTWREAAQIIQTGLRQSWSRWVIQFAAFTSGGPPPCTP